MARDKDAKEVDLTASLGILLDSEKWKIKDVIPDSPAARAGIPAGATLVAVGGRAFDEAWLRDRVRATADTAGPLELLVRNGEFYRSHSLEYHAGGRYPRLVRIEGAPDLLTPMIAPRASASVPRPLPAP